MKLEQLTFTTTDVVKLIGFTLTISAMWYDLKSDMKVHIAEHALLEWRMKKLENPGVAEVPKQHLAILPSETKIKDDK
jgi:hypothetical protein